MKNLNSAVENGWLMKIVAWSRLFLFFGVMSGYVSTAGAEEVSGLFQQSVVVADQSQDARGQAAKDALATVLVKVSGKSEVLQQPAVEQALSRAESFLESYRYESRDAQQNAEAPGMNLVISFSKAAVEGLLRRNQLPLWPSNRPSVLVWLVKDDLQHGRQLMALQDTAGQEVSEAAAAAQAFAVNRGVPLLYPLLDLQDRVTLTPSQLWGLDEDAIFTASTRYGADAVLIGRYSQTSSGQWLSAWTLLHKQYQPVFDVDANSEAELINSGLVRASEYLANLYAISLGGNTSERVLLSVSGLDSYGDYVQLLDYLQSIDLIREIDLKQFNGDQLQVALNLAAEQSLLQSVLGLDNHLLPQDVVPAIGSEDSVSGSSVMSYQWQP